MKASISLSFNSMHRTAHNTLHSAHSTVHTVHSTVYTAHPYSLFWIGPFSFRYNLETEMTKTPTKMTTPTKDDTEKDDTKNGEKR